MSASQDQKAGKSVCIVSGGAGGLGKGICGSFAEDGFHVLVVDVDGVRAEAVAGDLRADGYSASAYGCDITSSDAVIALRESVLSEFDAVDVLVNLAGVARTAVLSKVTREDLGATLDTHVVGSVLMIREFGAAMKKRGYGRIVNTSSIMSRGSVASTSYSAAKGAIEAMTRTVAIELAPFGVTVNCVAPGVIDAGMFPQTPKDFQEKIIAGTPVGRVGRVDEVAACVGFLCSKRASFITGQTISVCGGASIGVF